jgi:hypothetical protein
MNKEFVPYEIALALKELGFDEPCFGRYNVPGDFILSGCYSNSPLVSILVEQNDICEAHTLAPTFSQAFRFFREKYFKMCFVYYDVEYRFCFCIGYNDKTKGFKTYEEAELACLNKLIELIKNK